MIFLKLNPMFYIIDGFRDTFINKIWEKIIWTPCYLLLTTCLFSGIVIFKKLKPHFNDVLWRNTWEFAVELKEISKVYKPYIIIKRES